MAEQRNELHFDFKSLQTKYQSDLSELTKRKTEELKRLKSTIKSLKTKLESFKQKPEANSAKYIKLKQNFKLLLNENEQVNNLA